MTEITRTPLSSTTTTAQAVGAPSATAPLAPLQIERRALGPNDVRIDIKFCGICHSDIHFARGEWGEIRYPAIPGHEIAEVTVLSQSLRKQDDGLRLGADGYYATSDDATFEQLAMRFDLIVNTVSAKLDIGRFLTLLKTDGALVNVGAPSEPLPVPAFALLTQRRSFAGSAIGSIAETQEMLDFCTKHGIAAEIELISADQVNEAWERVLASDVRYRFVIDNSTLQR